MGFAVQQNPVTDMSYIRYKLTVDIDIMQAYTRGESVCTATQSAFEPSQTCGEPAQKTRAIMRQACWSRLTANAFDGIITVFRF
jgi:hypothetical protein